jgi:hypothetical protein
VTTMASPCSTDWLQMKNPDVPPHTHTDCRPCHFGTPNGTTVNHGEAFAIRHEHEAARHHESVEREQSGVRRIVRAAGDAVDHERVSFTFVRTHQDDTAISAFAFDRRIARFQRWRRRGHPFNERRRNDLERPLWKSGHCCNKFETRDLPTLISATSHALRELI